jgi:telomerase reverse transcriptase
VLNRLAKRDDQLQTINILRYIFPRQFGLHNAFTSKVDRRETAMPFKDYTLRDKEIHQSMCMDLKDKSSDVEAVAKWNARVPKRLRGATMTLVDRLRTLNHRCSYTELLRHYCPVKVRVVHCFGKQVHSQSQELPLSSKPEWKKKSIQPENIIASKSPLTERDGSIEASGAGDLSTEQTCFTDMACSTADVSAFCRAVVAKVLPNGFWGDDSNKRVIMYWIDQFIALRRFESLNLHQVTQKIQVCWPLLLSTHYIDRPTGCILSLAPTTWSTRLRETGKIGL